MAHQARAYPGFCSMKRLGVFLLPLDGMLVHRRVTPSIKFAGTHLYTRVEREVLLKSVLPKNTRQCPRPGFEPGPLDPETSALTMRPPRPSVCTCYQVHTEHAHTERELTLMG